MVTNFQEAKSNNREALRRGLLDAASRVLVSEGLEALTMRRVAQEVSASTKVLYTLFGSKEGLLEQLYREGFERLRQNLEAVPGSDDPLADLVALSRVYRETALANPTYFAVLFGRSNSLFKPSSKTVQEAAQSFAVLEQGLQQAVEAGQIAAPASIELAAKALWSSIHGAVSLELDGYFDDCDLPTREQIFALTLNLCLRGMQ